jgi:hypothetical protein
MASIFIPGFLEDLEFQADTSGGIPYWDGSAWQGSTNLTFASDILSVPEIRAVGAAGLKLYDDGGSGIFVEDGGNVGIGAADPVAKLDINTTDGVTDNLQLQRFANTAAAATVTVRRARGTEASPTTIASGDDLFAISARGYDGTSYVNAAQIIIDTEGTIATNRVATLMRFLTHPDSTTTVQERMRITSAGNIGIGTTTPANKLGVAGSLAVGASYAGTSAAPTNGAIIQGTVGIGTASPLVVANLTTVTLQGGTVGGIYVINSSAGVRKGEFSYDEANDKFRIGSFANINTEFLTNNSAKMTILAAGSVGIGTTSPDRLFHTEVSDAVTAAVTSAGRFSHITSGTAAVGFGTGIEFELEGADSTNLVSGAIENVWTDASTGAEDADMIFKVSKGGAVATEVLRIKADNNVVITGNANPEADGTRDLGTQTTAQWANVWSDLINGADYSYLNSWRTLEAEKYHDYPRGIAIGNAGFTDGVVTEKMPDNTKPVFAVTEDFIEFAGHRIDAHQWQKLAKLLKDKD